METPQTVEKHQCNHAEEYSVYVYYFPDSSRDVDTDWEMKKTTDSLDYALMRAKILYQGGLYKKVEVKKKSFDAVNQQKLCTTIKIYEESSGRLFSTLKAFVRPFLKKG